jgi:hypothetical protein
LGYGGRPFKEKGLEKAWEFAQATDRIRCGDRRPRPNHHCLVGYDFNLS